MRNRKLWWIRIHLMSLRREWRLFKKKKGSDLNKLFWPKSASINYLIKFENHFNKIITQLLKNSACRMECTMLDDVDGRGTTTERRVLMTWHDTLHPIAIGMCPPRPLLSIFFIRKSLLWPSSTNLLPSSTLISSGGFKFLHSFPLDYSVSKVRNHFAISWTMFVIL